MARIELNIRNETDVNVIIPQRSLEAGEKRFPVLWLLHDYGGNQENMMRFSRAELYAEEHNIAVVCPSGENSYFLDLKVTLDQNTENKLGVRYARYVTSQLRDALTSMLPLSCQPEDNIIAGVGMGGYAAVKLMLLHPELYGMAISIHGELLAPQLYAEGKFGHSHGRELFGVKENVAGGEDDIFTLARKPLPCDEKTIVVAGGEEEADRFCQAARLGGWNVIRDQDVPNRGIENLDAHVRTIVRYAANNLKERGTNGSY